MRIIRSWQDCPDYARNSVIALGNFDGLHLGHQAVIGKALEIVQKENTISAVLTFEPHPANILFPEAGNLRITPFRTKALLIKELGIDVIFSFRFNKKFSLIPANDFIGEILVNSLKVKHIVVGRDFVFGHKKSGSVELLRKAANDFNFGITIINPVLSVDSRPFSSTAIRNLIREGKISEAEKILSHEYMIEGRVIKGHGRAKQIGVLTANIRLYNHLRPAFGVYFSEVMIEGDSNFRPSISNIGKRPTFNDNNSEDLLETHIFDFNGDLYGKRLCVRLLEFIRPEKKFPDMESLVTQIKDDCARAREYFFSKKN